MNTGKKLLIGIFAILFINIGGGLIMKFFAVKSNTYGDYLTWFSFLLIMWIIMPQKNEITFSEGIS